jgi:hypothetical protein
MGLRCACAFTLIFLVIGFEELRYCLSVVGGYATTHSNTFIMMFSRLTPTLIIYTD